MSALPFDQRDGFIWMNGNLVAWKEAKLHVLSHGLHYASCVFEGERAYGGRIFKSAEHSERFRTSAELLDFEIPYFVAELDKAKPSGTGRACSASSKKCKASGSTSPITGDPIR
jgi:branched-chain amino acid aminotransferase